MSLFKEVVEAVEENNRINDGKWSDWEDSTHVFNTYNIEYNDNTLSNEASSIFIDALIRDNGENLDIYQQAIDCLEYGKPFSR